MTEFERPDLSGLDPEVIRYIESLETELDRYTQSRERPEREAPPLEPSEPPTTINLFTFTASGVAKRTPRHLYTRQRRGGMGIFDLETSEDDPPTLLTAADEKQSLLLFTNLARAFRLAVKSVPEAPIHARGQNVVSKLALLPDERPVAVLADQAKGAVAMISERGMVRLLRHQVFGEYMKPGTAMFDAKAFGPLAAAVWTPGDAELFIATRQGKAIRFAEKLVPPQGGPGIRLEEGDRAVAIASVDEDSGVFLLNADGRGTIRLMDGFNPNKSPGGGGKIAINADEIVGAVTVTPKADLFIISRLSKIIRFQADEVPGKEGVVQGVNCMSLRADETLALTTGLTG